jgi:hypothetical protein
MWSCGCGRSSVPSAWFLLSLGVEASDAGVELGSLLLVDPPGRDPFGNPSALMRQLQPFCRKWLWWYRHSRVRLQVLRYAYLQPRASGTIMRPRFAFAPLAGASTGRSPAVATSSPITLAAGQITRSDMITIELVDASETPPAVLIHWPPKPSVVAPSPKAITKVAASVVRVLAEGQARLATIRT